MPVTEEAVEESQEPMKDLQEASETTNPTTASDAAASTESSRPERNTVLVNLLKSINSPPFSFPEPATTSEDPESFSSFPPLFDDYGGEKRRAMREQQEEARLHIEAESQVDLRSVPEPLEEEEPESGSLQLGGEPEDRDNGREGSQPQGFHSQRRPSTQLPIQRASNAGGPFGPSLGQNFAQNLGNLSSINGRALTPLQQQQLLLLKSNQPQSGFMDQFPPGVGGSLGQGSSLFQQGHNRQSSRYSFANDSSSASSSVKPSANPKLMAQQSSMMPSGSHAQPSQFYGSSIPGPPPGLKSTGTPPISSGIFGQGHAFGSSMGGGSIFGGAQKENNSDMLRDMLRGRGGVGSSGSQAHDTGKLDLADPSILQARMQHQQQSNAGVGQGLFGGQAQGGYNPSMMYGAGFARW
jgi:CCR4-NOT transcription complex subunit 4